MRATRRDRLWSELRDGCGHCTGRGTIARKRRGDVARAVVETDAPPPGHSRSATIVDWLTGRPRRSACSRLRIARRRPSGLDARWTRTSSTVSGSSCDQVWHARQSRPRRSLRGSPRDMPRPANGASEMSPDDLRANLDCGRWSSEPCQRSGESTATIGRSPLTAEELHPCLNRIPRAAPSSPASARSRRSATTSRLLANLVAGVTGTRPDHGFDATGFEVRIAAEVTDFDPTRSWTARWPAG